MTSKIYALLCNQNGGALCYSWDHSTTDAQDNVVYAYSMETSTSVENIKEMIDKGILSIQFTKCD